MPRASPSASIERVAQLVGPAPRGRGKRASSSLRSNAGTWPGVVRTMKWMRASTVSPSSTSKSAPVPAKAAIRMRWNFTRRSVE